MKIVWAALIIVGAAGVAITAMLLVRRNAPDGGYFNDGDRASGVFGGAGHRVLGAARVHRGPRLRDL